MTTPKKRKPLGRAKRRTPLQLAENHNAAEFENQKAKRGKRPSGTGGKHAGVPAVKTAPNFAKIRTSLLYAYENSKAFGIVMKLLNCDFLTKDEKEFYSTSRKRRTQSVSMRIRRFRWVLDFISRTSFPKLKSESFVAHLHGHMQLPGGHRTLSEMTKHVATMPRDPRIEKLMERQRQEQKELEAALQKEKEAALEKELTEYQSPEVVIDGEIVEDEENGTGTESDRTGNDGTGNERE